MVSISVIVPVFNAEKYLKRCIDSILGQSYRNFELILIDDGSTDSSPSICDSYLSIDDRIIVKHIKNGGVANARNIGIEVSNYEYFMFVDSDDCIEENMLEEMCKYSENSDVVIAGLEIKYPSFVNIYTPENLEYVHIRELYNKFSYYYNSTIINSPCAKIYNKSILSDLRFDTSLRLGEDFDFNLKYFEKCNIISITDKTKYIYDCTNSDSATKKYHDGAIEELIYVNRQGHQFCSRHMIESQDDCLDKQLCKNGIHMLDIIANSDMRYKKKYTESIKMLHDKTFIKECNVRREDDSLKLKITKILCLLGNYYLLFLFFHIKRWLKRMRGISTN